MRIVLGQSFKTGGVLYPAGTLLNVDDKDVDSLIGKSIKAQKNTMMDVVKVVKKRGRPRKGGD